MLHEETTFSFEMRQHLQAVSVYCRVTNLVSQSLDQILNFFFFLMSFPIVPPLRCLPGFHPGEVQGVPGTLSSNATGHLVDITHCLYRHPRGVTAVLSSTTCSGIAIKP